MANTPPRGRPSQRRGGRRPEPRVTGTLGTPPRPDGTTQITYSRLPPYYWQGDAKAGDVTGTGVNGLVVATVGGAGRSASAAAASPAPSSSGNYREAARWSEPDHPLATRDDVLLTGLRAHRQTIHTQAI